MLAEYFHLSKSGNVTFQPYWFDLNYKPQLKSWGNRPCEQGSKERFVPTLTSSAVLELSGPAGVFFFRSKAMSETIALQVALADNDVSMTREALELVQPLNITPFLFR